MFLWVFPAAERIAPWPNWYRSSVVWSQVFQLCFWCHFSFSCLRDRLSFLCTKQPFILLQEPTVHFQHLSSVCAHDSSSAPQLNGTSKASFVIAWLLSSGVTRCMKISFHPGIREEGNFTASSCNLNELPLFDYSNHLAEIAAEESVSMCAPRNNMWDACPKASWILVQKGGGAKEH